MTRYQEYPLSSVPAEITSQLDAWYAHFIGKSPDEGHRLLRRFFSDLGDQGLIRLAERLLDFKPRFLVIDVPNAWIVLGSEDA